MPEPAVLRNNRNTAFEELFGQGAVCAFSSRLDGNMSLFYGDTACASANRRGFLSGLRIDLGDIVCARQVHGSNIMLLTEADKGKGALSREDSMPDTDGFITGEKNLPLTVFTADCLSIFLYEPEAPAIGLIHAGWRGSKEEIASKAVRMMRDKLNARPQDLRAGFGPAIRSCCYEVGADFRGIFDRGMVKREERHYLDLVEFNKAGLLDSGVREANILDPQICTSCSNSRFFSFRKEGKGCGRLMSVIALR